MILSKENKELVNGLIANLEKGEGSINFVNGESGIGKTALLLHLLEETRTKDSKVYGVYSNCEPPIGKFNVATLQPLGVYLRVIEQLMNPPKQISAKKKLALNAGLTLLTAIPIVGEVFYAAKELSRDWKAYKVDKSDSKKAESTNVMTDFYNVICSYLEKSPILLMIDDFHWADHSSLELTNMLFELTKSMPLTVIISFRDNLLDPSYAFFNNAINETKQNYSINKINISLIAPDEIHRFVSAYFPEYKPNKDFEEFLSKKSLGVAGIKCEYLRYFQKHSPFDLNWNLKYELENSEFVPSSAAIAMSKSLDELSEEEKNILAICSCEGREFSAYLISRLLNTDVLTTIRKFRNIKNNTDIIRSLGARHRYGVKTTVYEFSSGFYHNYFQEMLEYEEYQALHGQIASILEEQFNNSSSDDVKNEIAPYLAAHSSESGDEKTLQRMIALSDKNAKILSGEAEEKTTGSGEGDGLGEGSGGSKYLDFKALKNEIVHFIDNSKYKEAIEKTTKVMNSSKDLLNHTQKIQLLTLSSKSYIEIDDYDNAQAKLDECKEIQENEGIVDFQSECLVLNCWAHLYYRQAKYQQSLKYLTQAAELSLKLPNELKLMTITNIAYTLDKIAPTQSQNYHKVAEKLSKSVGYSLVGGN